MVVSRIQAPLFALLTGKLKARLFRAGLLFPGYLLKSGSRFWSFHWTAEGRMQVTINDLLSAFTEIGRYVFHGIYG
jgi:hypothetical protein